MSGKPRPRTAAPPAPVAGARWVPLTRGKFALVDEADWERVAENSWCLDVATNGTEYADSGRRGKLHRFLLDYPPGLVDHANGDGLDNRRANLRVATKAQNATNSGVRRNSKSRFKGVYPCGRRWATSVRSRGRAYYLGLFSSPEEAARAYDAKASEIFGEFARLNFPNGEDL